MASEFDEFYERVLCVKNEVLVFRIPPRPSNRGYRAADWNLDKHDWSGRLRVVAKGNNLSIKLEDKSGELFAECPVEEYPSIAVEPVIDSSRYFVIRIKDKSGRSAFIGIGFVDRGDSFDLNVALQDHFKQVKQEAELDKNGDDLKSQPKLDLGFKEGQTITINIGSKKTDGAVKPRTKATSRGTAGILPPPPGGVKIKPPPSQNVVSPPNQTNLSQAVNKDVNISQSSGEPSPSIDLLMSLDSQLTLQPTTIQPQKCEQNNAAWTDFTSNTQSSSSNNNKDLLDDWMKF